MYELDIYATLLTACVALLVGRLLVSRIPLLKLYSIPEPVVGGLVAAVLSLLVHSTARLDVRFETSSQQPFMLMFFASIGLGADVASLRKGGWPLLKFIPVVVGLLVLQNVLGIGVATIMGANRAMGLLAGSITLSGGHGTGIAWGSVLTETHHLESASEMALACATFGLVLGGLIGGPVAGFLVRKVQVPAKTEETQHGIFEQPEAVRLITTPAVIETLAAFAVCMYFGVRLAAILKGTAFEVPSFVCVLLMGVLLRNVLGAMGWYHVFDRAVSVLGNVSLAMFLVMALMMLKLWEFGALAGPVLVILAAQTALMVLYAIFVTFRMMGRNYDAAVLAAGHCGFGLGATPTAIANMQAVTDRYGPSRLAFIIVPIVGAMFIDIANALIIKGFLLLPIYGK